MSPWPPPDRPALPPFWRIAGYVLGVLIILAGPYFMKVGGFRLTTDSWSYLNVSWHVVRGEGLVLSQVDPLRTQSPDVVALRPLTQWPPLYSLLSAIPHAFGVPLDRAGWLTAYLSTVVALLLAWHLVLRHSAPWWAIPTAVALASAPALVPLATTAWSEGVAVACLMAAHVALDRLFDGDQQKDLPDQPPWEKLLWVALWAILGFHSRYAFVFAWPGLLLGIWWALPNRPWRPKTLLAIAGVMIAGCLPWIIRNLILAGTAEGRGGRSIGEKPMYLLQDVLDHLFGRPLPGISWAAALLCVVMLAMVFVYVWPELRAQRRTARLALLPVSALIQVGLLVWVLAQEHLDPLNFRFLAPITLLLLVTGLILAAELLDRGVSDWRYKAFIWILPLPVVAWPIPGMLPQHQVAMAWVLIVLAELFVKVGPTIKNRAVGWLVLVAILGFHLRSRMQPMGFPDSARHREIAVWMREHLPPGTVYAGSRAARDLLLEAPEYVQLIGVSSTARHPEMWLERADLERLQRRYGLSVLVFPGPPSPSGAAFYGPWLAELMTAADLPADVGRVVARGSFRIVMLAPPPAADP